MVLSGIKVAFCKRAEKRQLKNCDKVKEIFLFKPFLTELYVLATFIGCFYLKHVLGAWTLVT